MTNDNSGTTVLPFKPKLVPSEVTPSDPNSVDPAVVEVLERYLASAREGKIKFVALATVDHEGIGFSTWEPTGDDTTPQLITQALGAVSFLNHRFSSSCDEGSVVSDKIRD